MHRPRPPLRAQANKALPGIVRKAYGESDYFSTPDPVKVYKNHLNCEVVRTFSEWSGDTSRRTKALSLFTYTKAWRMSIIQHTRFPVDPAIKMDMKKCTGAASYSVLVCLSIVPTLTIFFHSHIMDPLIDLFELEEAGRFRGVMDADDVLAILHHHWVSCDKDYPGGVKLGMLI
jgi:hypothetical protein